MGALPDYWGCSALVSPPQQRTASHSKSRHFLSTNGDPNARRHPCFYSSPYLPHFLEQLLPFLASMRISVSKSHLDSLSLQRCVDELKQLYFPFKTGATSVIPSKTQEKLSKQFVGVCLCLCLCLCGLNPVPVCSRQLCLFFEGEGNVVGGFPIGAPHQVRDQSHVCHCGATVGSEVPC